MKRTHLLTAMTAMVYLKGTSANCSLELNLTMGPDQGVLQVLNKGSWGTVCYRYFTNKDAAVVCRTLGQKSKNAYRVHASEFITPEVEQPPSSVLNVTCSGREDCLADCLITYGSKSCTDKSLIGVVCTNDPVAATWQYKGQWLPYDVKEISVNEGDDISCAAIHDKSRYMSSRIYVPGKSKSLKSGVGKQTLTDIKRSQAGLLACNVSNGNYRDQNSSIVQLNVLYPKPESTTPVYIYIVSAVAAVLVVVVVVVIVFFVVRRHSQRPNVEQPRPIQNNDLAVQIRRPLPFRPFERLSAASSTDPYVIAVDVSVASNVGSSGTYDSIP